MPHESTAFIVLFYGLESGMIEFPNISKSCLERGAECKPRDGPEARGLLEFLNNRGAQEGKPTMRWHYREVVLIRGV